MAPPEICWGTSPICSRSFKSRIADVLCQAYCGCTILNTSNIQILMFSGRVSKVSKRLQMILDCFRLIVFDKYTYIHTYITLHYITLHCITLHYITLHYITYIHTYIILCVYIYIYRLLLSLSIFYVIKYMKIRL